MIRVMPEVTADVNGQMMALMQQRMPAMMERLKAELGAKQQPPKPATTSK
jgi:hypothetical protein